MTLTKPQMKNWRSFVRSLKLDTGSHSDPESGMCLLEAISYIQGQPFSDAPQCVAPSIAAFGRSWNDSLPEKDRQRLKRFIPTMIGTATTADDETTRVSLATDWLVRTFTPTLLDKAGLTARAAELRGLDALTSTALAKQAMPITEQARKEAAAAWAAAWDAAWDAAWAAARDAASKKKGYQAQYNAAYKAARPLIDAAFAETVKELQASAEDLLERMCAVGRA